VVHVVGIIGCVIGVGCGAYNSAVFAVSNNVGDYIGCGLMLIYCIGRYFFHEGYFS